MSWEPRTLDDPMELSKVVITVLPGCRKISLMVQKPGPWGYWRWKTTALMFPLHLKKPFSPEFPDFSIRKGNTKSLQNAWFFSSTSRIWFLKDTGIIIFFLPGLCCCSVQQAEFLLLPLAKGCMLKSGSLGRNGQREGGRLCDSFRVRASQCTRQIQIFLDKRINRAAKFDLMDDRCIYRFVV